MPVTPRHPHPVTATPRRPVRAVPRLVAATQLVKPLARAIDWLPVAVAALFALTLIGFVSPGRDLDVLSALRTLRASALLFGAAAAFALMDAMTPGSGALPVPRWLRQWLRTLMAFAAVAVVWGAGYTIAIARLMHGAPLPFTGTALEAAVCVLTGLAGAGTAVRHVGGRQAALAASALLGLLLVGSLFLTGELSLWAPMPGDDA